MTKYYLIEELKLELFDDLKEALTKANILNAKKRDGIRYSVRVEE